MIIEDRFREHFNMDCNERRSLYRIIPLFVCGLYLLLLLISTRALAAGYFKLHNIMSTAQKVIPANRFYNDANTNLQSRERNTGHVVNTTFANDGGMAGCGISSTLMEYIYQNSGTTNFGKNYIALNVYSQVMGFDPGAPLAGGAKGYLNGTNGTDVAYPNIRYHRNIPSLYPAYLGSYNNGLNCGRWVEANFDKEICYDRNTPEGISKFCPTVANLTYTNQKMIAYEFDSCEDNNGWCRDDAAHIDVSFNALIPPNNYYLQWKFIKNPYYTDPKAASWYKDFWLAWFATPSRYWSYVTILNAENGVSNMQFNVGSINNPLWINSHVLSGDNDVTWQSGSNNGQLWQIEPVNSITDLVPPENPLYQMRMFDVLGYPASHGTIYQFKLLFDDGTFGNGVAGYYFFYQGGARVKPGEQAQNMTLLSPPTGNGSIVVAFNTLLPSNVSLDSTQSNYLRPVLMSDEGYTWDPDRCENNQCFYSKLSTAINYHVFAHAIEDVSNDWTLRKVNDVTIHSANFAFPAGTTASKYDLQATDINLSTLYAGRVEVPLKFATTSQLPINGNLQALFIPNGSKNNLNHITAQTQGCFLNTYITNLTGETSNTTTCTLYYTVNRQANFSSTAKPPSAYFNVVMPTRVGYAPVNFALAQAYSYSVEVAGYNPQAATAPPSVSIPVAKYAQGTGDSRSLYLLLDPESDVDCLKNLDPVKGVTVTIGAKSITLNKADVPVETQITQGGGTLSAVVNLAAGAKNLSCQAMSAIVTTSADTLRPGVDTVDVIKLAAIPRTQAVLQGVAIVATGDSACMGIADTLIFSNNGNVSASVPYTVSVKSTNVGVNVPPANYTVADKPINVSGGSCQIINPPTVTIQNGIFVPLILQYQYVKTPAATCTAKVDVPSKWPPGGCNVVINLSSRAPLKDVRLSWIRGLYDWTRAEVWGGEGNLDIPANPTSDVSWALPSWINGQGQTVGMTINLDGTPSICDAFSNGSIHVNCGGIAIPK